MSKLKHHNLISIITYKTYKKCKIAALTISKEIKSLLTKTTNLTGANDLKIQPDGKINVASHLSWSFNLIQIHFIILNYLSLKE